MKDTQAPEAGTLTLADGAGATASATAALAITGREAGLTVRLTGALADAAPRSFALAQAPATLALAPGDGDKLVTAVLEDAAGNRSAPFTGLVRLDTAAPLAGEVTLAGGQCTVTTQAVALNVAGTDADRMVVWTEAVAPGQATCAGGAQAVFGGCAARPCDAPFSPAVQLSLGAEVGAHAVCWRFCDGAGNATAPAGRLVGLESFVDRPRPTLSGLARADDADAPSGSVSVVAFGEPGVDDALVVHGAGFAANTQALIGDVAADCAPVDAAGAPVDASACQANPDGGCAGGVYAASCAARCRVDLPPAVLRNGGTYLVRVATPAPVAGGVGTSEGVGFLTVVSPVPTLLSLDRRGVVQAIDAAGAPVAQTVRLTVTGERFMDNVQFRLGDNYAEVVERVDDADDPLRATVMLDVSTAGLMATIAAGM